MKLLIITCLKEYQPDVAGLLDKAKINVFSVSETTGFKEDHVTDLMGSWFAAKRKASILCSSSVLPTKQARNRQLS